MADLGTEAASVAAHPVLLHASTDAHKLTQSNYSAEGKHRGEQLPVLLWQDDPDTYWLSLSTMQYSIKRPSSCSGPWLIDAVKAITSTNRPSTNRRWQGTAEVIKKLGTSLNLPTI